ncbi:MAG TPA: glycoside hydrolase family 5 protein [Thermotogota bacterium]|nr:glycoside hydrolase family 5 protein [Thermotogota bacterium]HPJ89659.1 glycoside hydrolase family 5 protein [Thermotogota bacterium]HPR96836.1 glycoside hydrolase family 5 protein [Thermotogota bacterium]
MKGLILMIILPAFLFFIFPGCTSALQIPMPQVPFGKGINIANALEAPVEGEWGVVIQDWFFPEIASKGFETVRIPVDWSYHIVEERGLTIDNTFLERVQHVVDLAIANDLSVILSFHGFDDFNNLPQENSGKFIQIWERLTTVFLNQYPEKLFFELFNEPHDKLTAEIWDQIQSEAVEAIRAIEKERWLIITGAEWGNAESLQGLSLPENRSRILATFHMYEPYLFTHQGVPWLSEAYSTTGILWPGPPPYPIEPSTQASLYPEIVKWFYDYNYLPYNFNPAGPEPIVEKLVIASNWSKRTGVPLFMGEFGTYSQIDPLSRVNWTDYVRNLSEAMKITWIYWDFAGNFGLFDLDTLDWNADLITALGQAK